MQVVAGQALQSLCTALSSGGCLSLTAWILIWSSTQLLLCLLPDINSLTAVTAMGAATTLGFSVLATVGSALKGECKDGAVSWGEQSPRQHAVQACRGCAAEGRPALRLLTGVHGRARCLQAGRQT